MNKELGYLKEDIDSNIQSLGNRIKIINGNTLVAGLVSLFALLGLSAWLKLIAYWLPSSFVLTILWIAYGGVSKRYMMGEKYQKKVIYFMRKINVAHLKQQLIIFLKNFTPLLTAIAVIFLINVFSILLAYGGFLQIQASPWLVVPLLTSVIFVLSPWWFPRTIEKAILAIKPPHELKISQKIMKDIKRSKVALVFINILLIIVLYVGSIFVTWRFVENLLILALILLIQFVTLLIFASYFSGIMVKKEINNLLVRLHGFRDFLMEVEIGKRKISKKEIKQFRDQYLKTKSLDFFVDGSFKFVNLYIIYPKSTE